MNTHELLIAARKKIERPECWTQGCAARSGTGGEVDYDYFLANCWCGWGAIWAVKCDDPYVAAIAEKALTKACGYHFPTWQDAPERTHAEVMKVFDIAIENTRGEG